MDGLKSVMRFASILAVLVFLAILLAIGNAFLARSRIVRFCSLTKNVLEFDEQRGDYDGLRFMTGMEPQHLMPRWKVWSLSYRRAYFRGPERQDDIRVLIRAPSHPWSSRPRVTLAYRVYETDPKTAERRRGLAAMAERLLVDEFGFDPEVGRDIEVVSAEEQAQQRAEFERFMEHGIDFTAGRQG